MNSDMIEPRIESNKLRLYFQRRPCMDLRLPECAEPDPPHADFPNNWGGYSDVLHVDFKIPSEHTINGARFDGEMQIYHIHPVRRRTPTVVSVMKVSRFAYNTVLQGVLDRFQFVYNIHRAQCANYVRRNRRLVSKVHRILGGNTTSRYADYDTWADFSTELDGPDGPNMTERNLQQFGFFNPHDERLVPSIHFFGYQGSLTEPPCSEFVSWFITDEPMRIGHVQLEQMKRILFTHVTPTCEPTSVHWRQSVARPIQDSFGRPVFRCTQHDFLADAERFVT